jgi:hypothetical protein
MDKPKIMIDDGSVNKSMMLAALYGMALSMSGNPMTKRPMKVWSIREVYKRPPKTTEEKLQAKRRKQKKRARKNRRGY